MKNDLLDAQWLFLEQVPRPEFSGPGKVAEVELYRFGNMRGYRP